MTTLRVVGRRARAAARFACPWCGATFPARWRLTQHWGASADCRANRYVNSPRQDKYGDANPDADQPGTATLRLVRERSPETQP